MPDSTQPRVIGLVGATTVIAGTMLGVGILLTPPLVAAATEGPLAFFGLWVLGALVALAGADAYAELGASLPHAGGDVVFQDRAFGPAIAFASGSLMFALAFAGSIAALAVAVGTYQAQFLLTAAGSSVDLSAALVGPLTGAQLIGLTIVLALSAANAVGARLATGVQAACTLVPLVALTALGAWVVATGAQAPPSTADLPDVSLAEAWAGVYFSFAGWPAIVYVAGEVRDPGRTLPRAMLGGAALVSAVYLLLCAAFLTALGRHGLANAGEAGTTMVLALFSPNAGTVIAALVLLALLASINGTILGGARVAVAIARQGSLPAGLAHTDPSSGAPRRALLLQAVIASSLVLTGTFQTIVGATSLAMMVVGCVTVAALFVLRRAEPDLPRPYRAVAFPLSPAFYLVVSLGMIGLTLAGGDATLPIAGVVLLLILALGHRLFWRPTAPAG